jgi:hypothetical protein
MRYPPIYHAPDDGDDPQGGDSPKRPRPSDLAAQYHNDAMRVSERLAEVLDDNYKLREKNRTLSADLAAVKGKVPADGARVLSTDEAAQWEAYTALGAPDALKQQLATAEGAQAELTTLKRGELLRTAGEAAGYKSAVLAKLPSLAGKDLVVKDVEIDGKKAKQAFVVADGKEHALTAYITEHDPEFLPALTTEAAMSAGTQFVRQSAGGSPASPLETYGKTFQEARDAAPNPLAPRAPKAI